MKTPILQKVMAISMRGTPPAIAYVVRSEHGKVAVVHIEQIDGVWSADLDAMIVKYQKEGYTVIFDAEYSLIPSRWAMIGNIDLEEKDEAAADIGIRRTYFWKALDLFDNLKKTKDIAYAEEMVRYEIKIGKDGSRIDTGFDDFGRKTYTFDRDAFGGPQRAVLIALLFFHAPILDNMYVENYIKERNRLTNIDIDGEKVNPAMTMARALFNMNVKQYPDK